MKARATILITFAPLVEANVSSRRLAFEKQ
jgi:hypothetical protein